MSNHRAWRRCAIESLERRQLMSKNPLIIGGPSLDVAYHTAVDSAGNRIVAGIFSDTVDFDPSSKVFPLVARGDTDLYIAKYTDTNDLIWARRYGGGAGEIDSDQLYDDSQATVGEFQNQAGPSYAGIGEWVNSLIIGADDSILFAGSFQGTADFDPLNPTKGNIESAGYQDGFVCKLDSDGKTIWTSPIAGVFDDVVKSIALDSNGNIGVTGYFTRYADFNPSKKTLMIDCNGRADSFVQRLFGTNGGLDWVVIAGGKDTNIQDRDTGEGIAVDSNNNFLVTGSFTGKTDFAPGPGVADIKAIGHNDGYIWQLSPKGKMARIQTFGGDKYDSGNRIALDSSNNAYISGYFTETADLDPTSAVQDFSAAEDSDIDGAKTDIFVLKQTSDGATSWIKQFSGDGFEYLGDMSLTSDSAISISGGFAGKLTIGSQTITSVLGVDNFEDSNSRDYSYDAFYTQLSTSAGTPSNVSFLGSTSDDYGLGIVTDDILCGRFKGTVNFGTSSTPANRKSNGQDDGFLLNI